jgi:N-acetyltransferase
VSPPYRNFGVATQLMNAVRGHFVYGQYLSTDEVAFSAPTDDGKLFAESVAKRKDFFVYY